MYDKSLAKELADLRFENGYKFKNGTPCYEQLGAERAEELIKALRARGYKIVHDEQPYVDAPFISAEMETTPIAHS